MLSNPEENAKELLRLLGRVLTQRGDLLISIDDELDYGPDSAIPLQWSSEAAALPSSLTIFPTISLDEHSRQLERVADDLKRLKRALGLMMRDERTIAIARGMLIEEAQHNGLLLTNIDLAPLSDLFIELHVKRHQACHPAVATFAVTIVRLIDRITGDVEKVMTYHFPAATTWGEFQRVLQDLTVGSQARCDASVEREYSSADSEWMYQILRKNMAPNKALHELESETHYKNMRRSPKAQSKEIREVYEQLCKRAREEFGNEPLNADGTPMFEPFDPYMRFGEDIEVDIDGDLMELIGTAKIVCSMPQDAERIITQKRSHHWVDSKDAVPAHHEEPPSSES